jgi:3-deoxy-D-manno-octulosonate 8-phosphate phosphatase (KDO 8-P phosphatase)
MIFDLKLVILDVDGVLTNGRKVYDADGNAAYKEFCDRDFTAIKQFKAAGVEVIFLSGDKNVNQAVAKSRNIEFYSSRGVSGKLGKKEVAQEVVARKGYSIDRILFVGDDLFDVEMREVSQVMVCPRGSSMAMRKVADFILTSESGDCCVQEVYELAVEKGWIEEPSIEEVITIDASESVRY